MADQVFIQLKFTSPTKYGDYSDAIYLSQDEYNNIKPKELEALKADRVNNWVYNIENPPEPEIIFEDLQVKADSIQEQIDSLQSQKESLDIEISKAVAIEKFSADSIKSDSLESK